MGSKQAFWTVPAKDGEPDLWVCMSCLSEAFCRKILEAFGGDVAREGRCAFAGRHVVLGHGIPRNHFKIDG